MKTIVWFLYFWLYLLVLLPKLHKARRLREAGETAARDALVEQSVGRWARALLRLAGVKVEVSGLENIPDTPAVFVANHQSYFDIPVLLAFLDKPHALVAKQEIKKIPLIRDWMDLLGCVFIDRSNARQSVSALGEAARNLTQEGRSFIIFPEGTRSRSDQVGEFKNGGFRVAFKSGAPIVPVAISGTFRAMEANHMWIHSAKVTLQVLPAIPTAGLSKEESRDLGEAVRLQIIAAKAPSLPQ